MEKPEQILSKNVPILLKKSKSLFPLASCKEHECFNDHTQILKYACYTHHFMYLVKSSKILYLIHHPLRSEFLVKANLYRLHNICFRVWYTEQSGDMNPIYLKVFLDCTANEEQSHSRCQQKVQDLCNGQIV